jgi:chromosomal replication initiation ATPase DnaA
MQAVEPGFDSFTPTAGTRRALALAYAMATRSVGAPRLLFLRGLAGVGKTHILRAVVAHSIRLRPSAIMIRVTAAEVVERLVATVRHSRIGLDSVGWEDADVVALDDLHTLAGCPLTQREIARLFRLALAAGTRVLCAAGGLTTLRTLVAAVRNEPGFVLATLEPANDRELRRVLVRIAQRDGLQPDPRVLTAAAISADGDTRRAVGALTSCLFGSLTVAGGLVVRNPRVG